MNDFFIIYVFPQNKCCAKKIDTMLCFYLRAAGNTYEVRVLEQHNNNTWFDFLIDPNADDEYNRHDSLLHRTSTHIAWCRYNFHKNIPWRYSHIRDNHRLFAHFCVKRLRKLRWDIGGEWPTNRISRGRLSRNGKSLNGGNCSLLRKNPGNSGGFLVQIIQLRMNALGKGDGVAH